MKCIWRCWESWLMSLQRCCLSSLKDHEDWGRSQLTGKKANCAPILKKDEKDNPGKAVNQPYLSPLGTSWSWSSWNLFLGTWRRRWLGIASVDLPRVNSAWPMWLPFIMRWLDLWMRGEHLTLARLLTFSATPSLWHSLEGGCTAGYVGKLDHHV